ncbi:hypothetical protein BDZ90DRAFT_5403 [Jaminaea rosea]|uniref:Uncharacterized protein n=1 Tax=Jaminaea rosea TaxID=1569628 RepID=A0A316V0Q5_9BASI|nr:hypothetical protein BDZ90DRAFT_5403 [Jaminaea rosea]PWN30131.1 hypothetical protein BDZ90DRAFT_5403 [Jaminaea rosea]
MTEPRFYSRWATSDEVADRCDCRRMRRRVQRVRESRRQSRSGLVSVCQPSATQTTLLCCVLVGCELLRKKEKSSFRTRRDYGAAEAGRSEERRAAGGETRTRRRRATRERAVGGEAMWWALSTRGERGAERKGQQRRLPCPRPAGRASRLSSLPAYWLSIWRRRSDGMETLTGHRPPLPAALNLIDWPRHATLRITSFPSSFNQLPSLVIAVAIEAGGLQSSLASLKTKPCC